MEDAICLAHHSDALDAASGLPLGGIGVLALATETAVSLRGLDDAGVTPRLQALVFGAEDLAADLGIMARDENGKHTDPIVAARSAQLIAAAEARAPAIDSRGPTRASVRGCK